MFTKSSFPPDCRLATLILLALKDQLFSKYLEPKHVHLQVERIVKAYRFCLCRTIKTNKRNNNTVGVKYKIVYNETH